MNTKYIFGSLLMSTMVMASCQDMDTLPDGGIVTDKQKEQIATDIPERAEASVNVVFATFNQLEANYSSFGTSRHNDIGYPTIMLCTGSNTADEVGDNNGYNWTGLSLEYQDRSNTSYECQMVWNNLYSIIYAANNVIAGISADTEDANSLMFLSQGHASRAFAYLLLAQLYQFTYADSKAKPCVPIITDKNMNDAAENGCALSTVEAVYTQIKNDIDFAIEGLEKAAAENVIPNDKRYISLGVAYGIRARMNLVMQKYAEAAADAESAIEAAGDQFGVACAAYTDVNKPTFWSIDEDDWMWGIVVNETDDVVDSGIANWPSHMGSLSFGYANYSKGRQISKKLYAEIDADDARKGWWLDATGKSANLSDAQQAFANSYKPLTQVKFAPYKNVVATTINANDIPLMRVEEMYLIAAEGYAMSGDKVSGKAAFRELVENRFESAEKAAKYLAAYDADPQEAVYFQKRVELWGEGLIWYDIMRLKKGVDRRGCGFPNAECVFNIAADDDILLWRIPEAEIQANKKLTSADSPAWTFPTPVSED